MRAAGRRQPQRRATQEGPLPGVRQDRRRERCSGGRGRAERQGLAALRPDRTVPLPPRPSRARPLRTPGESNVVVARAVAGWHTSKGVQEDLGRTGLGPHRVRPVRHVLLRTRPLTP